MLFTHCERRAASRAACTAGNNRAMRMPIMAMTTSNSTKVKPRRDEFPISVLLADRNGKGLQHLRTNTRCDARPQPHRPPSPQVVRSLLGAGRLPWCYTGGRLHLHPLHGVGGRGVG